MYIIKHIRDCIVSRHAKTVKVIPAGQKDSNLCDERWFSCLTETINKHLSSPHRKVKLTTLRHAKRTQNPSSQRTQDISTAHAASPIILEVKNLQDVRAEIELSSHSEMEKSCACTIGLEYTKVMEIDSGRRSPADCLMDVIHL